VQRDARHIEGLDPRSEEILMSEQTTTRAELATTARNSNGVSSPLQTEHGSTTIADNVVSKIAGIATSDVAGVYALGGSASRAMGALRERIPGASTSHSQGVTVEVGEREAAVDLELVAEYGVSVVDLAQGVRRNVIQSVERMTGLKVTEVNISVNDVHLPEDESQETTEQPRVQ
jgi:uncharacterized alkaline shock family protein YloU